MGLLSWLSWSPRDEDLLQETRTRRGKKGVAASRNGSEKKRGSQVVRGGSGSKSARDGGGTAGARRDAGASRGHGGARVRAGTGAGGKGPQASVKGNVSKSLRASKTGKTTTRKKTNAKTGDAGGAGDAGNTTSVAALRKRTHRRAEEDDDDHDEPEDEEQFTNETVDEDTDDYAEDDSEDDDEERDDYRVGVEDEPNTTSGSDSATSIDTPRQKYTVKNDHKRHSENEGRKKLSSNPTPKPAPKPTPTTPYTMPPHFTKSMWKVRPLQVDEKLRVFIEGRDDGVQRYDGGDFQQWLEDCKAGRGDPLEAGAYPLVVQDSDLRQVLEIKYPSERALSTLEEEYGGDFGLQTGKKAQPGNVSRKKTKANASHASASAFAQQTSPITIPQWRKLPNNEWPDTILRQSLTMPLLVRTVDGGAEPVHRNQPHPVDESSHERAYIRYMMPTPDDWDQAIEYDLDEDDEKWLEAYNRRSKNNSNNTLKEEWLEHLIDRMEKEYTSELQKHPEKWTCKKDGQTEGGEGEGGGGGPLAYMKGQLPPPLILPTISEMFPLSVCMKVFGVGGGAGNASTSHKNQSSSGTQVIDEKIIKDVYNYWKKKHQKSGLPLIQRLWYEPPWHRKASDEDLDGGDEDTAVFSGFDLHPSLARIRKRKMNHDEVQLRFDCLRRDFEQVRTIADLIRRREKLKLQETSILKQEWASRMKDIRRASKAAAASGQAGCLAFSRPPKLASLIESKRSTVANREHRRDVMAEQEQKLAFERTLSEDRAARLAARRDVRAEALRIRRERIATKRSTSKPKPRKPAHKKLSAKKTGSKKGSGNKQPRSSTGQFQSFRK